MRILITGSRDWTDHATISNALRDAWLFAGRPYETIVIHGGARGADYLAGTVAKRLGFGVELHKARWDEFGKAAGFLRNKEMVDAGADLCLAFIRNESKGATMCAALAEKAGIPTHYWREP
jgi:hypothetical protein